MKINQKLNNRSNNFIIGSKYISKHYNYRPIKSLNRIRNIKKYFKKRNLKSFYLKRFTK